MKIDRLGRSIPEKFAHRYYNSVALGIDFTARDIQSDSKKKGLPWEPAKAFDYSAPVSEFVPFTDEHRDGKLDFHLDLNGKTVQNGNITQMIFHIDRLIAYVSRFMTLKTGDLLFTGTPSGVGPVAIGDHLEGYLSDQKLLDFFVK